MSPEAREHLLGATTEEILRGLSAEQRELFQRADLGIQIEAFLAGDPVGQFLAHMTDIERESAVEALIGSMSNEPENHALHQKHHRRIERCDTFRQWLADAIQLGREAQQHLDAMERSD